MKNILIALFKPETLLSRTIIALLIIGIIVLAITGHLDHAIQFLDSEHLTFTLGNTTLSAYKFLKGLIALISLFWFASLISDVGIKKLQKLQKIKSSNKALLIKGFQVFIYFVIFLVALDVLGIDLTTLAIFSGAIGIGLGFGLQKITSNFISGIILLFEKSVEEGDLVELADGTSGFIRHTGARYTLMETFENREILIPNEDFITNRVTNWTYTNTKGRISITLGVSYGSDLNQVFDTILEAATEHPRCSTKQPPECYLDDFGDSSVNFTLFFWVDDIIEGRKRPKSDVLFSIWKKFKERNIEIPFPQRDIHIKNGELLK